MKSISYNIAVGVVVFLSGIVLAATQEVPPDQMKVSPNDSAIKQETPGDPWKAESDEEKTIDKINQELANPVSRTFAFPFGFQREFHVGPDNKTNTLVRAMPVYPFDLGNKWSLLTRAIFGARFNEFPNDVSGLTDTQFSMFVCPPPQGKFFFGAGPLLSFPTASDKTLGSGKWGAGPTFVAAYVDPKFATGMLASHLWSYAGPRNRDEVSASTIQPFFTLILPKGWNTTVFTEAVYNWKASGEKWSTPLTLSVGKVFDIGHGRFMNVGGAVSYYPTRRDYGPEWDVRFGVNFILPTL